MWRPIRKGTIPGAQPKKGGLRRISRLRVRARPGNRREGWLIAGCVPVRIALGRGGIKADKREGDGATPRGRFRLIRLWFRPERGSRPGGPLPKRPINQADAWIEDPQSRNYNRAVKLAPGQAGDRLWRDDALYDVLVELDHNTRPRVAGRGSAVFIHVARPGFAPTAGCVAMPTATLRRLLVRLSRGAVIDIQ
ncbi:MAG: hypothetical protein QOD74_1172 [Variibacter sp.]|nr:hypothetical protein [Variibacter sp.]